MVSGAVSQFVRFEFLPDFHRVRNLEQLFDMSNTNFLVLVPGLRVYRCRYREEVVRVNHLVDVFLDHLSAERGLAANTRSAYREDLAEFTSFLRRKHIDQIQSVQRQDITDFLMEQRKPGFTARGNRRDAGLSEIGRRTGGGGVE